jgi:DNA-binding transcriptional LysR family regulator
LLPALCRQILQETPKVTLELVVGMNDVLRSALRKGQLDLVLGPLPEVEHEEFKNISAMQDEVVVVAREGHPLLDKKIKMVDLLDYHWVLPATTVAMRQWLDRAFISRGLRTPNAQIESTSISLLPRLIAATDFLSFISRRNLGAGRVGAPLREIKLAETTMHRRLGVTYRRDSYLSPAAKRVINLISANETDGTVEPGSRKSRKPAAALTLV